MTEERGSRLEVRPLRGLCAGRTSRRFLAYVLPLSVLFIVGFLLFPVSGTDDKYITYWSAHALATLGQIVNYNGERVEQCSSLTHVAVLAALARLLPVSMPALGWLVSVSFGVATVPLTQRLARWISPALVVPAGLITGSAVSLAYWSFGGMEATLAAFLGAGLLLVGLRVLRDGFKPINAASAAAVTLLFVGVRPETVFVAAAVWSGVLMLPWIRRVSGLNAPLPTAHSLARRAAILLLMTLTSFAALAAFRYAYFRDIFPQPVRAKVGGPTLSTIYHGLRYLLVDPWPRWDSVLWPAALAGMAVSLWRAARATAPDQSQTVVALFLCAQIGFVVFSGGDWMEAGRFLVPLVPAAAIMAAWVLAQIRASRVRRSLLATVVAVQLFACVDMARLRSPTGPLWAATPSVSKGTVLPVGWFDMKNRTHAHLVPMTAELLEVLSIVSRSENHRVTISSGQMGFVPFYVAQAFFGRVRFVDMGGLVTRDVTQLPAAARLRRSPTGVLFWYHQLFALTAGNGKSLDAPDILFDYELTAGPDAHRQQQAEAHGYAIVFRQNGFPSNGSVLLPGRTSWRDAFIAVRRGLWSPGTLVEFSLSN
jgi:hypothetical protein